MVDTPVSQIPVVVRTTMGHAAVQALADGAGLDVLHLKGPAADASLRAPRGPSSDIDVLVRPSHLDRLLGVLLAHGWSRLTSFERGSAFEHAAVWHHPTWGSMDLHRRWPGFTVDPETAFERIWGERDARALAGQPVNVPCRAAEALILLLHVARGPATRHAAERAHAWDGLSDREQEQVRALVEELGAQVPFALVMDDFDSVADQRTADLWWVASHGGGRLAEWRARLKAAPNRREAVRTGLAGLLVSRDYVRLDLQREPTALDLARYNARRARRAVRELVTFRSGSGARG